MSYFRCKNYWLKFHSQLHRALDCTLMITPFKVLINSKEQNANYIFFLDQGHPVGKIILK